MLISEAKLGGVVSSQGKGTLNHNSLLASTGGVPSRRQTSLRPQIRLLLFYLLPCFCDLPTTKQTTLCGDKHSSCHTGQQKPNDIQGVVLQPGEVVGGWPQVLGSFVAHDILDPEDCSVQGL